MRRLSFIIVVTLLAWGIDWPARADENTAATARALRGAGIGLTTAGAVLAATGIALVVAASLTPNCGFLGTGCPVGMPPNQTKMDNTPLAANLYYAALSFTVIAPVVLALGIPIWVKGARRMKHVAVRGGGIFVTF